MPAPLDESAPDTADVRQAWNDVAAGWQRWWATIEEGAHVVSAR